MNVSRKPGALLRIGAIVGSLIAALALLSGCSAGQRPILAGNLADATATFPPTATPMPQFVLGWVLFGTPTPGGPWDKIGVTSPGEEPVAVAAVPTATRTLPPTATLRPTVADPSPTPRMGRSSPNEPSTGRGNASQGRIIFTGMGTCNACHDVQSGVKLVGPSLKGIANRAGEREPGLTAAEYLRESILTPNKFVVSGFSGGVMPQNFRQILSDRDVDDLVAYLLTLQ